MNIYHSNQEGVWLTPNPNTGADEPKYISAEESASVALNQLYDANKPALQEDDRYEYISMDVSEDSGSYWGILNCRVNNEHVQVRF
jgi:hypothetical protein